MRAILRTAEAIVQFAMIIINLHQKMAPKEDYEMIESQSETKEIRCQTVLSLNLNAIKTQSNYVQ